MILCIRCRFPVIGPVPGTGRVPAHAGHVDATRNATCGWWGFEYAPDESPEEQETP